MKKHMRILVIDDERSIRELLVEALKPHAVIASDSGLSALELLSSDSGFDLILLDYLMVGLDGIETLKLLKSTPATKDIPVIIASGLTDSSDIHQALSAGAVAFINKPLDLQELNDQISKLFSRG
jgi:CheY-like chemotaxis protein